MADTGLIQVRVDEKLKKEVTEIYESLGIDMPTAIRMFLNRSRLVRGIPFELTLPEETGNNNGTKFFEELRKQAETVPEMSLDEINAEINAARRSRKGSGV
ncbi:MAG: type II toxin-antitoxin system RelB/DinJ family antitoxin [Firmicutes bacterium]|nr:type II toxin-antitoxin system RelB/DinJ family antitoxin [Bacillota bacterium]